MEEKEKYSDFSAERPVQLTPKDWWRIVKRIVKQLQKDHLIIVAPGVAFYLFLAVIPAILALTSIYGLFFNPEQIHQQLAQFTRIMPKDAGDLITNVLLNISAQPTPQLELEVIISIVVSLWIANLGMKGLFRGVNIVYQEKKKRNFFQLNGITLLFTISSIVVGIISLALIVGFPVLIKHFDIPPFINTIITYSRWIFLGLIIITFISIIYKFAPERRNAQFKWVTWGAAIATILWLVASWGFSYYVEHFSDFDQRYGTLASVVILMLWFLITSFLVLLGAEINAEMEYQTKKDTTIGQWRPLGERNAYHADHYAGQDQSENN